MPNDTPDQQITLPIDPDTADNPLAFTNFVADVERRLVRTYASEADRAARRVSVAENDLSALADVDRVEVYNGSLDISLYRRSLYSFMRKGDDQTLTPSNTTLQNVTGLSATVPATGAFSFRGVIYFESTAVADIKFAFSIPAGGALRWTGFGPVTAGGSSGDANFLTVTASDATLAFGGGGTGVILACKIEGEYVGGGTAGTLQFRAAQNTSEATNSRVIIRSRLEMWRHG